MEVQTRLIEKLVFNTRNPRRNDKTVDRVYGEVGLKIPYLARSGTRRKSEGGGRGTNRAGRRSRRAIRSGAGGRKGSRNKPKSEAENLLDQYAPQLMKTCIGLAAKGNPTALRLCIERLLPARRGASVRVRLPPIKTVQDVDKAADRVMRDVGRGKLTPADGERMVNILEGRSRILDSVDNASRIDQLERDWAAAQKRRPAA